MRCEAPGVDEAAVAVSEPVALVRELASRKALSVARRHPEAWVIGADQVAFDPGRPEEIWGKPPSPEVHLQRLKAMRGRSHALVTGLAVVGPGIDALEHERTDMVARADLEDDELARYVASGEGSGCAGGYAAEGRGAFLFERIDGDWFNVLGLPLYRLLSILRAHGWRYDGGEAR